MGRLHGSLTQESPGKSKPIPTDIRTEAKIAERVLSDVEQVNGLGDQVPYNCPNCGGVLWEMESAAVTLSLPHRSFLYHPVSACKPVRKNRRNAMDIAQDVRRTQEIC